MIDVWVTTVPTVKKALAGTNLNSVTAFPSALLVNNNRFTQKQISYVVEKEVSNDSPYYTLLVQSFGS
jgi:ABC-type phosphate/phosphonate transport system permease subunit